MLAASGVAKQKIDLLPGRGLICFVTKRRRICSGLATNDFNAEPFCPDVELLDSCGTKSICGCEHDRAICVHEIARELCRRCCLASAIHAHKQNYGWLPLRLANWCRIARQNARELFADSLNHIADSQQRPRLAFLERFDDAHRHRHSE